MLHVILNLVQMAVAIGIVGLVLLQRGKGADAGAGFGAGASGTVFGARGASTVLSRATAILAAIFMINSLLLTYLSAHDTRAPPRTLLDRAAETQPAPPAAGSVPPSGNVGPAPAAPPAAAPTAPAQSPATQP